LLAAERSQEIPLKRRSQTFVNAGEVILERLETGQGGPVYGSFALPALPEAPENQGEADTRYLKKDSQKRLVREIQER
jgi:hypothetical protein